MKFINFFQKKKKEIFFLICSFFTIVLFQNCGQGAFHTRLPSFGKAVEALDIPSEISNNNEIPNIPDIPDIPQIDSGKIYYVATNGSDSNQGTKTAPFKTIARGSKEIESGDTLYIRAGTYNELGPVLRNGTANAYTRYAAYPGEERKVIIKPPTNSAASINIIYFPDDAEYIEVRGLVIDGGNLTTMGYGIKGIKKGRVINNLVRNFHMGLGGGRESQIIGNEVYNMSDYGIYTGSGDNGLVQGNIFRDCGGFAIHHYKADGTVNDWTFSNNIIYRSGRAYDHSETGDRIRTAPAVLISSGRNNKFYNNIVYDSHGGISVGFGAVDSLIANNTVYGNDTNGINVSGNYSGSQSTQVFNNISYGNGAENMLNSGNATLMQNNLTVDPKFVDAKARNFRLQEGSPAINTGITVTFVPTDFLGISRPRGGVYDIGAYEYINLGGLYDSE